MGYCGVFTDFDFFGWVPSSWRLHAEYDLFGFYFTPIILIVVAAILLGAITAWSATRLRLDRFVWHPPLFLLGMMVIYGCCLSLMLLPR